MKAYLVEVPSAPSKLDEAEIAAIEKETASEQSLVFLSRGWYTGERKSRGMRETGKDTPMPAFSRQETKA